MERVDKLRAESDAILVGMTTVVKDDPKLTIKSEKLREERIKKGLPENPIKIAVGNIDRIRLNSEFLNYGNSEKILFTTENSKREMIQKLRKKATICVSGKKHVNLRKMVQILSEMGVKRIMVEGGGTINFELLKRGLVDEIHVAIAPKIIGGKTAPTLVDGDGFSSKEIINLDLVETKNYDEVIVLRYKVK